MQFPYHFDLKIPFVLISLHHRSIAPVIKPIQEILIAQQFVFETFYALLLKRVSSINVLSERKLEFFGINNRFYGSTENGYFHGRTGWTIDSQNNPTIKRPIRIELVSLKRLRYIEIRLLDALRTSYAPDRVSQMRPFHDNYIKYGSTEMKIPMDMVTTLLRDASEVLKPSRETTKIRILKGRHDVLELNRIVFIPTFLKHGFEKRVKLTLPYLPLLTAQKRVNENLLADPLRMRTSRNLVVNKYTNSFVSADSSDYLFNSIFKSAISNCCSLFPPLYNMLERIHVREGNSRKGNSHNEAQILSRWVGLHVIPLSSLSSFPIVHLPQPIVMHDINLKHLIFFPINTPRSKSMNFQSDIQLSSRPSFPFQRSRYGTRYSLSSPLSNLAAPAPFPDTGFSDTMKGPTHSSTRDLEDEEKEIASLKYRIGKILGEELRRHGFQI